LGQVKTEIQSKADFEYIRETDLLCGVDELNKIAAEIDKYSLNRLLIAGCTDPGVVRQILEAADERGINRYNIEFIDLTVFDAAAAAVSAINCGLEKLRLRAEVGYEELEVIPDVLVIGAGEEAAAAANAIAKNQPVVMIDNGGGPVCGMEAVKGNARVTVKTGTKVIGLDGFPGGFTARLLENGQTMKQDFGAIVIAIGAVPQYDKNKYGGVETGERVMSLSQFMKASDAGKDFTGSKVSLVLGKADLDSLLSFAKFLRIALELKDKGAAEVSIIYDQMKVCADNLEQEYEQARKQGVNFLKYDGEVNINKTSAGAVIQLREPFLSLDPVRIESDYVVLAEDYVPVPATAELAEVLDLRTGPGGFFQKDNVHFLPVKSNRAGIYFVGACHGPIHGTDLYNEIEAVVAEVSAFAKGRVRVPSLQPKVEAEKCAVCLTCYRCCPYHAIEIVHGDEYNNMYYSAARMHPLACQRCGICAAECPGKAIQLPLYSDQEILFEVKQPAKIMVYACENSGYLAAETAESLDPQLQKDLQIVKVPCAGKIDIIYLLKALENGADGVMLCACHEENCKYIWGNVRAEQRKARVQQICERLGLGDRIDLVHVAANQGNQFNTAVKAMAEKIRQSGSNPGKVV
jgi:heterodisulfide reductase subunit A-like polyferredoxin/coenzyme F420-reducing hydrogenase delta subunit